MCIVGGVVLVFIVVVLVFVEFNVNLRSISKDDDGLIDLLLLADVNPVVMQLLDVALLDVALLVADDFSLELLY